MSDNQIKNTIKSPGTLFKVLPPAREGKEFIEGATYRIHVDVIASKPFSSFSNLCLRYASDGEQLISDANYLSDRYTVTLLEMPKREFKVGDKVWIKGHNPPIQSYTILAIAEGCAWLKQPNGDRITASLDRLKHVD